ncbi:SGNH/GDSL hydrolase family protein [Alicyclobacillus mali]|uniref:SGNH/GDSL hydrolase family protein n=1 Tax=Alicyclobacillus mali (ex Roth et al. 2021) TaxID=1123961 RepID=A0ABS0F4Q3_9BACL|nr:SGNH/GDSL hydrolase family protein [Alicyclobacillus mali (ex Roth et al. 2021)]MBF8378283.1 SGNH/GDSL hydrolase family protein [Alicyclobacillus mali (ex Roth et al. 2021)]
MRRSRSMRPEIRRAHVWRRRLGWVASGALLAVSGWCVGWLQSRDASVFAADGAASLSPRLTTEKVMVVGGSMAHGWKDPHDDSYLRRAFAALSASTDTTYVYDDRTVVGGSPVTLDREGEYLAWLEEDRPQVVVLSWGLLNDIYDKTPLAAFRQAIADEIEEALAEHAVVLVVTSPVTKATATYNHAEDEAYMQVESDVVSSFDNPNVYYLDLNRDMTLYMEAHHQTWKMYYGDAWHPNEAGHILAGKLLFDELVSTFGMGPIEWQSTGSPTPGNATGNATGAGGANASQPVA